MFAENGALAGLYFSDDRPLDRIEFNENTNQFAADRKLLNEVEKQLGAYFKGDLKSFSLPLTLTGTSFQKAAWETLRGIPYGQTISYGAQSVTLGSSSKARAVGQANGRNPVSIIVPCHRVIAASGGLGGYSGGLERKIWLLRHEGVSI